MLLTFDATALAAFDQQIAHYRAILSDLERARAHLVGDGAAPPVTVKPSTHQVPASAQTLVAAKTMVQVDLGGAVITVPRVQADILQCLSKADRPLSLQNIAEAIGVVRSTVFEQIKKLNEQVLADTPVHIQAYRARGMVLEQRPLVEGDVG